MSSQKTETHWQARASEVGLREQLEQANGRAAVAEARADFADQAFAACHAEGEELRERVDELTASSQTLRPSSLPHRIRPRLRARALWRPSKPSRRCGRPMRSDERAPCGSG